MMLERGKMKVLVTGGAGFIGSNMVEALIERGYDVVCLLRPGESTRWIKDMDVRLIEGDLTEKNSLFEPVKDIDYIYHLAARMGGGDNPSYVYRVNHEGSKNLIDACIESGVKLKRFLFASSVATVGPTKNSGIYDETATPNPKSVYGKTKLLTEIYLQEVKKKIPYTIVRLPLVYGPRSLRGMYSVFKIINSGYLLLTGKCDTSVGFVKDVVTGMIQAAESPVAQSQTYLIGEDKYYCTHEITRQIVKAVGKKTFKIRIPYFFLYSIVLILEKITDLMNKSPMIRRDSLSAYLNSNWRFTTKKAREELNFKARYPLPEGLKITAEWYRENGLL